MSFFQTGNFAVLDLEGQKHFPGASQASPSESEYFWGPVAVTPPIPLDNFLLPKNREDEALVYPWDIKYAQNGRFAVATHVGTPDKGSAISIIHDQTITKDFENNLEKTVSVADNQFPYYLVKPLCEYARPGSDETPIEQCRTSDGDLITYRYGYDEGKPLVRPRGVAIQPFVSFVSPVFGDHVGLSTGIHIEWRDTRGARFRFVVSDWDILDSEGKPTVVGCISEPLTSEEKRIQFMKREFFRLFPNMSSPPVNRHKYKVEALVSTNPNANLCQGDLDTVLEHEISRENITVRFEGF